MVSVVKVSLRHTSAQNYKRIQKRITTIANKAITKAVAQVMKAAIQTMASAAVERPQSTVGPKIGVPIMKQPSFNWKAEERFKQILKTSG